MRIKDTKMSEAISKVLSNLRKLDKDTLHKMIEEHSKGPVARILYYAQTGKPMDEE